MFSRSLRSRIVLTLSVVVLPVAVLAFVWAWSHDHDLRAFRASSARHAAALIASKLDDTFRQARLLGAMIGAPDARARRVRDRVSRCS